MRILIAGANGALGSRLIPLLVERGDEVFGITRSDAGARSLRALGATALIGDVLDRQSMKETVPAASADAVVQILNALPKNGPRRFRDMDATNDLRTRGTRHLVEASLAAGVKRYVVESMVLGYGYVHSADGPATEDRPFLKKSPVPEMQASFDALNILESEVNAASREHGITATILRMGLFYGPGVGSTEFMVRLLRRRMLPVFRDVNGKASMIHIDDAVRAIAASLSSDAPGGTFNIADDEPVTIWDFVTEVAEAVGAPRPWSLPRPLIRLAGRYASLAMQTNFPVDNGRAKATLVWSPSYPTYREGLRTLAGNGTAA